MIRSAIFVGVATLATAGQAQVFNGVVEDFNDGPSNWFKDSGGFVPLTGDATGGQDGSGVLVSTTDFSVNSAAGIGDPSSLNILYRAQQFSGSSDGLLFGDYLAAGITEIQFDIFQDTGTDVEFFSRLATVGNFPGVTYTAGTAASGECTTLTVDLALFGPDFIFVEPSNDPADYFATLGAVGRLQIGAVANETLAGTSTQHTFLLDNVRLVPTPGAAAVLGLGLLASRRRR